MLLLAESDQRADGPGPFEPRPRFPAWWAPRSMIWLCRTRPIASGMTRVTPGERHAVVLGSGFSRAIGDAMPTLEELRRAQGER